ncbi:MAG: hypothetical protein SFW66_09100 [Gammaproteobacteria bacterium]|nr:hypothetical protein [Gammaproteobacteria bacterium]
MAITINESSIVRRGGTNNFGVTGTLNFDSSYPTGGEVIYATDFALSQFHNVEVASVGGYTMSVVLSADRSSANILVYTGGTASAQTFTGSASALNLASPDFSGTGLTAVGQVLTTTDNQTMTLNQCAGRWLVKGTGATPPNLILSNTAVTGAPAVLTVQGAASTDAGTYKIVSIIPVGTNATSSVGAGSQVSNGTNLSSLTNVQFTIEGV